MNATKDSGLRTEDSANGRPSMRSQRPSALKAWSEVRTARVSKRTNAAVLMVPEGGFDIRTRRGDSPLLAFEESGTGERLVVSENSGFVPHSALSTQYSALV
jgi:hypothetical protein